MATPASSPAPRDGASRHIVAVVAFDRISPFHLSVPCAVFGEDRSGGGLPDFDFRVCAAETGALTTTAGFSIAVTHGLEALADAHIIIVPSWRDPDEAPPAALLDALRAAHARGAQLSGCAWARSCWPPPASSTIVRPRRTGHGPTTSLGATRACGSTPTCSTSTTAT